MNELEFIPESIPVNNIIYINNVYPYSERYNSSGSILPIYLDSDFIPPPINNYDEYINNSTSNLRVIIPEEIRRNYNFSIIHTENTDNNICKCACFNLYFNCIKLCLKLNIFKKCMFITLLFLVSFVIIGFVSNAEIR